MNNIETMKLALEALEYLDVTAENYVDDRIPYAAITALRQAIEQAQQAEPVAWINGWGDLFKNPDEAERGQTMRPLYTTPPPRQPLSDEEIFEISNGFALFMFPVETRVTDRELAFARAIEKAVNKQPRSIPLTDDEMWKLWNSQGDDAMEQQAAITFARAIEAAHGIKEKNT